MFGFTMLVSGFLVTIFAYDAWAPEIRSVLSDAARFFK